MPLPLLPIPFLVWTPNETLPGDHVHSLRYLDNERLLSASSSECEKPTPQEWRLVITLFLSSVLLVVIMLFGTHNAAKIALGACMLVTGVIFALLHNTYSDPIFKALCTISFVHQACFFILDGALDAFYTAGDECYEDGPHFDLNFYYGIVQVVSCVVGVFAAWANAGMTSRVDTRSCFISAIAFRIFTGIFELIIIRGWNRE